MWELTIAQDKWIATAKAQNLGELHRKDGLLERVHNFGKIGRIDDWMNGDDWRSK